MSYKRVLIRLLDRRGGRLLLGKAATHFMSRAGADGVEIAYIDGLWTRLVGRDFFPDGPKFEYGYADFEAWKRQAAIYETDTREYWLRHYTPVPGQVIIDVGAGHGEDTLTFSRGVGPTGRVIAIEAHPVSFRILRNFCTLNGLKNVTTVHAALMDKPGAVRVIESPSSWTENEVRDDRESNGIQVASRTLDEICETYGIGEIAFLKMNIEGAERYALRGMERTMPRIRQICVACHDFRADLGHGEHLRTRTSTQQLLARHGFTILSRSDGQGAIRDHVFGIRASES